jgi:hypothetical protein
LIEIGSATLSPTWDAIIAASPAVAPPVAVATPAPAAAPASAPATPAKNTAPPIDDDESFKQQVDSWVEQDLAPPSRTLTRGVTFVDDAPAPARRPAPRTAPRGAAPTRAVTVPTDWPRDRYAETYMHRRLRKWAKRGAIALGVFVTVNVAIASGSYVSGILTPQALPPSPKAPASAVPALAAPATAAPAVAVPAVVVPEAPRAEAPAPVAVSGEYFVAVGLFADRERADQLVDTLTQAGLSAMQRPFEMRRQQVQQIVLGPFFSRVDAARELQRLQALGGYGDAKVIAGS